MKAAAGSVGEKTFVASNPAEFFLAVEFLDRADRADTHAGFFAFDESVAYAVGVLASGILQIFCSPQEMQQRNPAIYAL